MTGTWTCTTERPRGARWLAAIVLRAAGAALARLAARLDGPVAATTIERDAPRLEFHAEAGAPEGALYVDGFLIGHLPGINRL